MRCHKGREQRAEGFCLVYTCIRIDLHERSQSGLTMDCYRTACNFLTSDTASSVPKAICRPNPLAVAGWPYMLRCLPDSHCATTVLSQGSMVPSKIVFRPECRPSVRALYHQAEAMAPKDPIPKHAQSSSLPAPIPPVPPTKLAPPLTMKVNLVCYNTQYTEPAKKALGEMLDRK